MVVDLGVTSVRPEGPPEESKGQQVSSSWLNRNVLCCGKANDVDHQGLMRSAICEQMIGSTLSVMVGGGRMPLDDGL